MFSEAKLVIILIIFCFQDNQMAIKLILKVILEASVMQQCSSNIKSNVTKQMRQFSTLVLKIQILSRWS